MLITFLNLLQVCHEWIRTCVGSNIPLSKSDHPILRNFLNTRVRNGGAIPGRCQLQTTYLPDVYKGERELLKKNLAGKKISIIFDEMSDDEGRFVLNVLFAPLEINNLGRITSYLADTLFLQKTNHATVSQAVIRTLTEYNIDFNDVIVFDTDNAAYMKKAYKDVFSSICPKAIHVTCLAHILDLVGESFRKPFAMLDNFMKRFTQMFYNMAAQRKGRYLRYLKEKLDDMEPDPTNPTRKARMAPDPIATRWSSWFFAAKYHLKYFDLYADFLKEEMKLTKTPPVSVQTLHELLSNPETHTLLNVHLAFVVAKSEPIVILEKVFQSRVPCSVKAFDAMEDLQLYFETHKQLTLQSCNDIFAKVPDVDNMTIAQRLECIQTFKQAFDDAGDKLQKYLTDGQPGIEFLKAVRIFNPCKVYLLPPEKGLYVAIPGMDDIPIHEWVLYTERLARDAAARAGHVGQFDVLSFWHSVEDRVPTLSQLAATYVNCVTNSADAERSFSLYNLVVTCRRTQLSQDSIKALVFLYYNLNEDVLEPEPFRL